MTDRSTDGDGPGDGVGGIVGVVGKALDAVPEQAPPTTRTGWMDSARVLAIGASC